MKDTLKNLHLNLNWSKINIFTILSFLLLLSGVLFYIYWGLRFGVWMDIGIYSITSFLVLSGLLGILVTLHEVGEES